MSGSEERMAGAIIRSYRGTSPGIAAEAVVAAGATVVGAVTLGAGANVWYGCVLRGDDHPIQVGARSNIQDGTVIHGDQATTIGCGVVIGHGARLHGCTLEDDCLVGIGAIVLDGVVVENGAMVAAGAVVPPGKRIPAGQLWGGNPAKHLREVRPAEAELRRWQAGHYLELARAHTEGDAV